MLLVEVSPGRFLALLQAECAESADRSLPAASDVYVASDYSALAVHLCSCPPWVSRIQCLSSFFRSEGYFAQLHPAFARFDPATAGQVLPCTLTSELRSGQSSCVGCCACFASKPCMAFDVHMPHGSFPLGFTDPEAGIMAGTGAAAVLGAALRRGADGPGATATPR